MPLPAAPYKDILDFVVIVSKENVERHRTIVVDAAGKLFGRNSGEKRFQEVGLSNVNDRVVSVVQAGTNLFVLTDSGKIFAVDGQYLNFNSATSLRAVEFGDKNKSYAKIAGGGTFLAALHAKGVELYTVATLPGAQNFSSNVRSFEKGVPFKVLARKRIYKGRK